MVIGRLRRRAVASLATLLIVVGLLPAGMPAGATPGFSFTRVFGSDRYETAKAVAEAAFTSSDGAIVATGERFADALAGNYLAGQLNVPILLTRPNAVTAPLKQALANLKVRNVLLLGGTQAVGSGVEADLRATDSTATGGGKLAVSRLGGADRYETARLVSTVSGTTPGSVGGRRTALLATGDKFADALAAGPAAFSSKLPVLLTPGAPATTLSSQARTALQSLAIEHVIVLGGTQAVTSAVETEVLNARGTGSITITRLAGSDRTETARQVAEYAVGTLGFVNTHVNLARGDDPNGFADALTGGPNAGREKAPIVLAVSPTVLSQPAGTGAERFLRDHASTLTSGHIFGGTAAISDAVEATAEAAAGAGATTPAMAAATANTATNIVSVTYSEPVTCTNDSATRAQFSYAGATPTTPTAITCNGTATVTLQFTDVTAGGALTYTDDSTAVEADDIRSEAGMPAKSPDTVTATVGNDTTRPEMTAAVANATAETVTLTYSEPVTCADTAASRSQFTYSGATGGPTALVCNETSTVTLTFAGVTGGGTVTYTDANSGFDAGDVADLSGNQAVSPDTQTATVTGDTIAPRLAAAVANTESDTVTATYSEPVVCSNTVETRIQFAYGAAAPATPADVTCNGTATVLLRFLAVTGGGTLTYTDDSAAGDANDVRDVHGNQATSPDSVTAAAAADTTAPQLTAATANSTADAVVVTYSEAVECQNAPATWTQFSYAGATPRTPAAVLCDGSATVVLTFDAVTDASAVLTYTDATATLDDGDVRDVAGNQAKTPDQVTAVPATDTVRPDMVSAVANPSTETVTATYSEPVVCVDNANTRGSFTFTGSGSPLAVICNGSTSVALVFASVTGAGTLTYTDTAAAVDQGDVLDLFGNQAVSPDTVSATSSADTTPPQMTGAVANTVSNTVTVTYSEPVTCRLATGRQFTYTGAASPSRGTQASCAGTTVTVRFGDVTGDGTITYTDDDATKVDADDVLDLAGNPATSPQSRAVASNSDTTAPQMASATASTLTDTVAVVYSEPVTCSDSAALRGRFSFVGATTDTPAANVLCNGTNAVVLRFDNITAGGLLSYTDPDPATTTGDVVDLAGNPAKTPDSVTAP